MFWFKNTKNSKKSKNVLSDSEVEEIISSFIEEHKGKMMTKDGIPVKEIYISHITGLNGQITFKLFVYYACRYDGFGEHYLGNLCICSKEEIIDKLNEIILPCDDFEQRINDYRREIRAKYDDITPNNVYNGGHLIYYIDLKYIDYAYGDEYDKHYRIRIKKCVDKQTLEQERGDYTLSFDDLPTLKTGFGLESVPEATVENIFGIQD